LHDCCVRLCMRSTVYVVSFVVVLTLRCDPSGSRSFNWIASSLPRYHTHVWAVNRPCLAYRGCYLRRFVLSNTQQTKECTCLLLVVSSWKHQAAWQISNSCCNRRCASA
jgi:hypothetical protein